MNSPTEHQSITKQFINTISKIKEKRSRSSTSTPDSQEYMVALKKLLIETIEIADGNNKEELKKGIENPNSNPNSAFRNITIRMSNLCNMYSINQKHLKDILDEDKQIKIKETQAHLRNVIARAATTLVIGFSIMLVYWVAHELKIPMPMIKLPVG